MALKPGDSEGRLAKASATLLLLLDLLPLPCHVSFVKVLGGTLRIASRRVQFFAGFSACSCMMGTFCGFYV